MAVIVTVVVVVALVLILALIMDIQDRRHGRKSRVRMAGWLDRAGRASVANSPEGCLADTKGVGSTYSGDRLREGDRENPPTD